MRDFCLVEQDLQRAPLSAPVDQPRRRRVVIQQSVVPGVHPMAPASATLCKK
jgi:hypothetical protein